MQMEGSSKAPGLKTAETARDSNDSAMARPTRAPMSTVNLKDAGAINGKTEKCTRESGKME